MRPPISTKQAVLRYAYPAVILLTFLTFFRARWALNGAGFDESCYLEYVHKFVGLTYPHCYSHSHFPGVAILWIPAAALARALAFVTSQPVDLWLTPLTGLVSFLCWALSLYVIALIWLEYRAKQEHFSRSWAWPVVFLFSIPVLAYAVHDTHLAHAAELAVASISTYFLVKERFLLATLGILFLTATRLNDAPMFLMLAGALLDGRREKRRQSNLIPLVATGGMAVIVGLVIYIGFFGGYHGIKVTDIARHISAQGLLKVLLTKHLGMLWFMPHWLLIFGIGVARFRQLSWLARGALAWMLAVLAFHVGHAVWWGGHIQQVRYLIGTGAALLIVTLELLPRFSLGLRRLSHATMAFGALLFCLYNWVGADSNTAGMLVDASIFSNRIQYEAGDHSMMPQFTRKAVLEPLGTSPIGFTLFSWFSDRPAFASFHSFSQYAFRGPPLWLLTFLALSSLLGFFWAARQWLLFVVRRVLAMSPLFIEQRLDRSGQVTAPFRYPIDRTKIARLLEKKRTMGAAFPKVGILVVAYQASQLLVETLERIPDELLEIVDEVFVFDDFSQDDTYELARQLGGVPRWRSKLRVHRNLRNLGYGGNQKVGFTYALEKGMDYVVLLHGDGQYAPELLPDLIYEAIEKKKPVVFGSRMMDRIYALRGGMPFYKWLGNTILTHFENLMLGTSLTEFHSGYRLYATSVLRQIPFLANTDDFHFDTQIIIQCRALGECPEEFPIPTYYGNEICRVNGMAYAAQVCLSVIRYRLHQIRLIHDGRYNVRTGVRYQLKSSPYSSHGQILALVSEGTTVLDVGCGPGLLAQKLAEKKVAVSGIDFADEATVWKGFETYTQVDLERDPGKISAGRKYDYVILADVLEHVRTRADLLGAVRPLLKPDGKLIVSTGNVALWYVRLSLLLGRFNYGDRGILDRTHVHLYTRSTFEREIVDAGYRILSLKVTGLPFELVLQSTGKSLLVKTIDRAYYFLAKLSPSLFAYQFVIEAEIASLENARGEGKIALEGGLRKAA